MKALGSGVLVVLMGLGALPGAASGEDLAKAARSSVSQPSPEAAAVATLRAAGPAGKGAMLALAEAEPALAETPAYHAALDAVCAQKDCAASHLFWYTDFAAARAAAAASGRPILSLRLLGRLDEELSCANSRYFRTVLYADPQISLHLRDRFILHWQSVRPVPKVTIDFGDGRRLEGTITGNSLHYVLDSKGRLIDALPGLYAPEAFKKALDWAEDTASATHSASDKDLPAALSLFHRSRYRELQASLAEHLSKDPRDSEATLSAFVKRMGARPPSALEASAVTSSKSIAEVPTLRAVSPGRPGVPVPEDEAVKLAAAAYQEKLSAGSRSLLAEKFGNWVGQGNLEASIDRFEELIAEDTARNELLLHAAIHARLAATTEPVDLNEFTDWVYDTLFLTPPRDPWMGLAPREVYSVLTPVP